MQEISNRNFFSFYFLFEAKRCKNIKREVFKKKISNIQSQARKPNLTGNSSSKFTGIVAGIYWNFPVFYWKKLLEKIPVSFGPLNREKYEKKA